MTLIEQLQGRRASHNVAPVITCQQARHGDHNTSLINRGVDKHFERDYSNEDEPFSYFTPFKYCCITLKEGKGKGSRQTSRQSVKVNKLE